MSAPPGMHEVVDAARARVRMQVWASRYQLVAAGHIVQRAECKCENIGVVICARIGAAMSASSVINMPR
eukprot:909462-Pleurochrysis_carterae.AAC.1